jgi:hypothetical protein
VGTSELRSRLGRVAAVGLLGALVLTFSGQVPALAFALAGVVIYAALHVPPPQERPEVCGSCGRRFDSRRELRAHREAVHVRAPAMHSS